MTSTFAAIRAGLAALPRAEAHDPDEQVAAHEVLAVPGHRAALDPDRALVVGNRGMGKSFWAHALTDASARQQAAVTFRELTSVDARMGFNAAQRSSLIAPTPGALRDALTAHGDADAIWRAVMVRAAIDVAPELARDVDIPHEAFPDVVAWVKANGHVADRLMTEADDAMVLRRQKLVIVFDALDRLADDWGTTRILTDALLRRALDARSFRALRLKVFMRRDQFDDPKLFAFADASKVKNTRVELAWSSSDLYTLLFARLAARDESREAFADLCSRLGVRSDAIVCPGALIERHKEVIDAIAGEHMGADRKRGRVYTWLPLHLADSRGETSPRTFLTAWREAAHHQPAPMDRAVDHLGILEGVRKASQDRLAELKEDYGWIGDALEPLQGEMVPMLRADLESIWLERGTIDQILRRAAKPVLAPVQLQLDGPSRATGALVDALEAIGVIEIRSNNKINVPDIFRVEAGIKRKGGVKPPLRNASTRS